MEDGIILTVEQSKREILRDIKRGIIPPTVATYSELHDYVDANLYGGAEDCWWEGCTDNDEFCAFWNQVQRRVDLWLRNGRK